MGPSSPGVHSERDRGLHILTRVALTLAPICESKNLTLSQYRHLFLIAEAPRRAGALAKAFEVSRPMVAMSIRALEDRGLVARRPVPDDGRGVEIHITASGSKILERRRASPARPPVPTRRQGQRRSTSERRHRLPRRAREPVRGESAGKWCSSATNPAHFPSRTTKENGPLQVVPRRRTAGRDERRGRRTSP